MTSRTVKMDDVMDAWDNLQHTITRVTCSLPSDLGQAVENMIGAQSKLDHLLKTMALTND